MPRLGNAPAGDRRRRLSLPVARPTWSVLDIVSSARVPGRHATRRYAPTQPTPDPCSVISEPSPGATTLAGPPTNRGRKGRWLDDRVDADRALNLGQHDGHGTDNREIHCTFIEDGGLMSVRSRCSRTAENSTSGANRIITNHGVPLPVQPHHPSWLAPVPLPRSCRVALGYPDPHRGLEGGRR
jgi:hypothetical protein